MMEHTELIREMALLERWTAQDRLKLAKQRREKQVARWFENEQSTQSESNSSLNHRKKLLNVQFPENIILLEATARQDFNEVFKLLETEKYDPNLANEDGLTPMHQCAIDESEAILHLLIKYGANINATDRDQWTPLHAAATCGHFEICKILIDNGANLLALNGDGNMPYDICEDEATLDLIESEMDRAGITQELIDEARLVPEEKMLKEIMTFLKDNSSNQIQSIKKILSYRDHDGATILHIASAYGYQKVIDYLIQRNVPLDSRDNDGWTPIHVAVFWGHIYVIKQLIEAGANIHQKLPDGRSALDLCEDPEARIFMVNIREQYLQNQEKLAAAALAASKNESREVLKRVQYSQSLNSALPNSSTVQMRQGNLYESRSSISSPYDSSSSLNRSGSIRRISSLDRDKVKKFNESFLDVLEARSKIKEISEEQSTKKEGQTDSSESNDENRSQSEKESAEKSNSETTVIKNTPMTSPQTVISIPADTLSEMKKQRIERRRQVAGPFSTEIFPIESPGPVAIHNLTKDKSPELLQRTNNETTPKPETKNDKNQVKVAQEEKKRICCTIL